MQPLNRRCCTRAARTHSRRHLSASAKSSRHATTATSSGTRSFRPCSGWKSPTESGCGLDAFELAWLLQSRTEPFVWLNLCLSPTWRYPTLSTETRLFLCLRVCFQLSLVLGRSFKCIQASFLGLQEVHISPALGVEALYYHFCHCFAKLSKFSKNDKKVILTTLATVCSDCSALNSVLAVAAHWTSLGDVTVLPKPHD